VHSRTKNSFLQAGDLGECGPASEGEVAKAKSSATGSNPEAGVLECFKRAFRMTVSFKQAALQRAFVGYGVSEVGFPGAAVFGRAK
jgi:hypothetical protein